MRAGVTIGNQHRKQRRGVTAAASAKTWRQRRNPAIGVMASSLWRQKRKRSVALGGIWHESGKMAAWRSRSGINQAHQHGVNGIAWQRQHQRVKWQRHQYGASASAAAQRK
jgi:hypothetical protein